jgi:prepilin-type N-terminal cleavage/methylation domain-containing protein
LLMKMRGQMQKGRNQKGFTLVELMVVVVIIGVLVAIAVPVYTSVQAKAERSACHANLRTIDGMSTQWQTMTGAEQSQVGEFKNLFTGKVVPQCPTGGVYTGVDPTDKDRASCPNHPWD